MYTHNRRLVLAQCPTTPLTLTHLLGARLIPVSKALATNIIQGLSPASAA